MLFFNRKKIDKKLKEEIKDAIVKLKPWYQPIEFVSGVKTVPVTKAGHKISLRDLDRGIRKWNKMIKPVLPFPLEGKVVMDCGCNAGLFLVQSCKEGAKKAIGIEVDDHYFKQANFVKETFSKIENRELPIELNQSSFEDFNYESVGKVDITFFLNTVYHIGRATHADKSPEEVLEIQAKMLSRIAENSTYIFFQSNSLEDEGRGKGKKSLHEIINKAGLKIVKEVDMNHARGLITLVSK